MLAMAADRLGWARGDVRVLDIAAGNGVSGEALAAEGLGERGLYGTDIVACAREAALRDRPGLYGQYLTLDLLALTDAQRSQLTGLRANALSCVAPVGERPSELPPAALRAAAGVLEPDALVVYMHDPAGGPDAVTADSWGPGVRGETLQRARYLHRRTVNGAPFEMDGVVWRLRRGGDQAQ